jgi:hypothetical protein
MDEQMKDALRLIGIAQLDIAMSISALHTAITQPTLPTMDNVELVDKISDMIVSVSKSSVKIREVCYGDE